MIAPNLNLKGSITRFDVDWWRGKINDYKDEGPVTPGSKTRRFSIFERKDRSLVGYIKWFAAHKGYSLYPLNNVFGVDSLCEIAEFCQDATRVHWDRIPPKKPKRLKHGPNPFKVTISRREILARQKKEREEQEQQETFVQTENGLVEGESD